MTLENTVTTTNADQNDIGHVDPIIGRTAKRDVLGYYGFPIIASGQTITPAIAAKAESMGRLFEVIAATE